MESAVERATTERALLVQIRSPQGNWVDAGFLYNKNEINWFESLRTYWELPDRPVLGRSSKSVVPVGVRVSG